MSPFPELLGVIFAALTFDLRIDLESNFSENTQSTAEHESLDSWTGNRMHADAEKSLFE